MAGRVSEHDVAEIKQRASIFDVVSEYVTLRRAGAGSFKGLCPFHEERTPSFHVNVNQGFYKCFGCGEGGDAIKFLQTHEHLSFIEAVERLAEKFGYHIKYEEIQGRSQGPSKTRLYEAHRVAGEFYVQQLATPAGQIAVDFLAERGFDTGALERFNVGYSPDSWEALTSYLRQKGFSVAEITASGLVMNGSRGNYDRFRGRIMWPIKNITGQIIGFGARKLLESDQGPKYLNSPESPIYQKSHVLYGLDAAKRDIANLRSAIIVEGYTDVMACHLAGATNVVATCGTAFGAEHIQVLRRVLGDDTAAEVIFTFDADSAGETAALKAFGQAHKFNAQTYIATNSYRLDPSDLRQLHGNAAVLEMFKEKTPLFEFALQHAVQNYNLAAIEGRYGALRNALPIIATIKDASLQSAYMRELSKMVWLDYPDVQREYRKYQQGKNTRGSAQKPELRKASNSGNARAAEPAGKDPQAVLEAVKKPLAQQITLGMLPQDAGTRIEIDALCCALRMPLAVGAERLAHAATARVDMPPLRQVRDAIAAVLPNLGDGVGWVEQVAAAAPEQVQQLVYDLAMIPLPNLESEQLQKFVVQSVALLQRRDFETLQQELIHRLRAVPDPASTAATEIRQHLQAVLKLRREFEALFE